MQKSVFAGFRNFVQSPGRRVRNSFPGAGLGSPCSCTRPSGCRRSSKRHSIRRRSVGPAGTAGGRFFPKRGRCLLWTWSRCTCELRSSRYCCTLPYAIRSNQQQVGGHRSRWETGAPVRALDRHPRSLRSPPGHRMPEVRSRSCLSHDATSGVLCTCRSGMEGTALQVSATAASFVPPALRTSVSPPTLLAYAGGAGRDVAPGACIGNTSQNRERACTDARKGNQSRLARSSRGQAQCAGTVGRLPVCAVRSRTTASVRRPKFPGGRLQFCHG